jgi:hypothetical protein
MPVHPESQPDHEPVGSPGDAAQPDRPSRRERRAAGRQPARTPEPAQRRYAVTASRRDYATRRRG